MKLFGALAAVMPKLVESCARLWRPTMRKKKDEAGPCVPWCEVDATRDATGRSVIDSDRATVLSKGIT